jgi:hypothetical protein
MRANESAGLPRESRLLILEWTGDRKEPASRDNQTLSLEDIMGKDDIGDSGLVFQREEDEAFGCA